MMAVWFIRSADDPADQGSQFDDQQALEPGADGFLDVISAVLEGTDLSATYVGPSPG